jgi:ankyrin repeat protein
MEMYHAAAVYQAENNVHATGYLMTAGDVASYFPAEKIGMGYLTVSVQDDGLVPLRRSSPSYGMSYFGCFSGTAHRFEREFCSLFPDFSRADWNGVLHWVMELKHTESYSMANRNAIFEVLLRLFTESSTAFAVKLIEDSLRPETDRVLFPDSSFGGIAGGGKYREHSEGTRLFKFAFDTKLPNGRWIYGGTHRNDRLAMKSASHELKSAQVVADAVNQDFFFPLMCVYTWKGKRVTCLSMLPIEGSISLVQGSDNGGKRVVRPSRTVDAAMNLLGHSLMIARGPFGIIGPFDMEVHRSTVDGKLYIIDAARLLPPEAPPANALTAECVMYNLLRPELLQKAGVALVPDAYFHSSCVREVQDIANVTRVLDAEILVLAKQLQEDEILVTETENVKRLLHSRGINMRHLKRIISLLDDKCLAKGVLVRALLEKEQRWKDGSDTVMVKWLRPPTSRSRKDLERQLAYQKECLSQEKKNMMQLIPTLLQLSSVVGKEIAIEKRVFLGTRTVRAAGNHPLVTAFDLCVVHDGDFVYDRGSLSISKCSLISFIVIFELVLLDSHLHFPSSRSLAQLATLHTGSAVSYRVKKIVEGFSDDDFEMVLRHAAEDVEWRLLESQVFAYSRHKSGAVVCARSGNLDLMLKLASPTTFSDCLVAACDGGQVHIVEHLLGAGVDVNCLDSCGMTALFVVCQKCDMKMVHFLLAHNAEVNSRNSDGSTPLHISAQKGYVELVKLLISEGAHVGAARPSGIVPLHLAASSGSVDVVRVLIAANADADALTKSDGSALGFAVLGGHFDVFQCLLELGCNVNVCGDRLGPLGHCVNLNQLEMVKMLVQRGVNLEAREPTTGLTVFSLASARGYMAIAEYLLEHGADINATCWEMTALHAARWMNRAGTEKWLLEKGCRPTLTSNACYNAAESGSCSASVCRDHVIQPNFCCVTCTALVCTSCARVCHNTHNVVAPDGFEQFACECDGCLLRDENDESEGL